MKKAQKRFFRCRELGAAYRVETKGEKRFYRF